MNRVHAGEEPEDSDVSTDASSPAGERSTSRWQVLVGLVALGAAFVFIALMYVPDGGSDSPSTEESQTPEPTPPPGWQAAPAGEPEWEIDLPTDRGTVKNEVYAAPDGYVVETDGYLYRLDAAGELAWDREFPDDIYGVLVFDDQIVVYHPDPDDERESPDKFLFGFDVTDGAQLWKEKVTTVEAAFEGAVYTNTCAREDDEYVDCELSTRDPATGEARWTVPSPYDDGVVEAVASYGATASPHPPYTLSTSGERVIAMDPDTGEPSGPAVAVRDDFFASDHGVLDVSEPDDSCAASLRSFDPETGDKQWEQTIGLPTYADGSCDLLWNWLSDGDVLPAMDADGRPQLLDLASGKTLWTAEETGTMLAWDGDRVFVRNGEDGDSGDVSMYSVSDDEKVWTVPDPQVGLNEMRVRPDAGSVAFDHWPTYAGEIEVFDVATGEPVFAPPGAYCGEGDGWFVAWEPKDDDADVSTFRLYSLD
ncbi:MAG: PQQ-binding-like beta-propeller repeat protein [Stackebrandtia sp.]